MKKEESERKRERSVWKLFNTIKYYIFHYNYSIKMSYCVVVGCSNNSFRKNREKGKSFYSFPKGDTLKQKWIQNIKQVNLPNDPKICHYHFESSCFKRDLQVNIYILDFNLLIFIFL